MFIMYPYGSRQRVLARPRELAPTPSLPVGVAVWIGPWTMDHW